MVVYSYGGAKILAGILNSIAMLCNKGFMVPIMLVVASIGVSYAATKAFYKGSTEELFQKWFFPFMIGYAVLFVPKKTVILHDVITGRVQSIDNVPFGLAFCASLTSLIGYRITEALETVLHCPDDMKYIKTGHIFGSDTIMNLSNYAITDEDMANNMKKFVCNCVVYDLLLGRYSFHELKSSSNLWKLIKEKTVKNTRGLYFCENSNGSKTCKYMSCHEVANSKFDMFLSKQSNTFAKNEIFGKLPFVYQALTSMSQESQELITQQIMMHSLISGLEKKSEGLGLGHNYSIQKAYLQKRSTMQISGAIAGNGILALRGVLEAMIFLLFLIVIPALTLPVGLNIFFRWSEMLLWINLWPPLYVMLNYVLSIIAQQKAEKIFSMYGSKGLNLYTNIGLSNLYNDMHAFTGWASLFIPALAYGIVRGSFSAIVSIASSYQGGVSSAASAAASEKLSGNYSYGNVSFDTMAARNQTILQNSMAPRLSHGNMREDLGHAQLMHSKTSSGSIVKNTSVLPFQINAAKMMSKAYTNQADNMMSEANNIADGYSKSLTATSNAMSDFTKHAAQNKAYSKAYGTDETSSVQESAQYMENLSKSISEKYGMSETESRRTISGMFDGLGTVTSIGGNVLSALPGGGKLGGSILSELSKIFPQKYVNNETSTTESKDFGSVESFQKHYNNLKSYSMRESASEGNDEGSRFAKSMSHGFQDMNQKAQRYESLTNQAKSYREMASLNENESMQINQKMENEFIDFVASSINKDGLASPYSRAQALNILQSNKDSDVLMQKTLLDRFSKGLQESVAQTGLSEVFRGNKTMEAQYKSMNNDSQGVFYKKQAEQASQFQAKRNEEKDFYDKHNKNNSLENKFNDVKNRYENNKNNISEKVSSKSQTIQTERKKAETNMNKKK